MKISFRCKPARSVRVEARVPVGWEVYRILYWEVVPLFLVFRRYRIKKEPTLRWFIDNLCSGKYASSLDHNEFALENTRTRFRSHVLEQGGFIWILYWHFSRQISIFGRARTHLSFQIRDFWVLDLSGRGSSDHQSRNPGAWVAVANHY